MDALENAVAKVAAGEDIGDSSWVIDWLDDADEWVVSTAAEACGALGLNGAIPSLMQLVGAGVSPAAPQPMLGKHGYAMAAAQMNAVEVRLAAVRALGRLGVAGRPDVVRVLRAAAENQGEHPIVARAAREELARATRN